MEASWHLKLLFSLCETKISLSTSLLSRQKHIDHMKAPATATYVQNVNRTCTRYKHQKCGIKWNRNNFFYAFQLAAVSMEKGSQMCKPECFTRCLFKFNIRTGIGCFLKNKTRWENFWKKKKKIMSTDLNFWILGLSKTCIILNTLFCPVDLIRGFHIHSELKDNNNKDRQVPDFQLTICDYENVFVSMKCVKGTQGAIFASF